MVRDRRRLPISVLRVSAATIDRVLHNVRLAAGGSGVTRRDRLRCHEAYRFVPSIKQGPDGALHIAFTYFRQAIKYVHVPENWVRADKP